MINLKLNHIGYAVTNMKNSIYIFKGLGYEKDDRGIIEDSIQNVCICFLKRDNETTIELVGIRNEENNPIRNILSKIGCSAYHMCYETSNINEERIKLAKIGFKQISRKINAIAFNNSKIMFLYAKDFGLIELIEIKNE